jgi:glucose-6-phosphate 1-dehydrogenase
MEIRSPNPDTLFALFGAGGDLSRRLIVPALFNLYLDGQLPPRFRLLGIDRQDRDATALAESFRQGVVDFSRRGAAAPDVWARFAAMIDYQRMDLTDPAAYTALGKQLSAVTVPTAEHIFVHGNTAVTVRAHRARTRCRRTGARPVAVTHRGRETAGP